MNHTFRAFVCALSLAACLKRSGPRESEGSEAPTQVATTVPDAPAMPAPIAPIPVAPTPGTTAAPVMPGAIDAGVAPMPTAAPMPTPTVAVAPGAVNPTTPPPAAPLPPPAQPTAAAPTQPAPAPTPTAQPTAGSGGRDRPSSNEVVNLPGVGPVRVQQGRGSTSVNVGGIRINLPTGAN